MPVRRLPIGAAAASAAAIAALAGKPATAFVAPAGIAHSAGSCRHTTCLSAGSSGGGITFLLSPSSLTHLSYLDGPDVPPPVYASTLTSDDDETDANVNDDVAASGAKSAVASTTATATTSSSSPSLSTIISAKLPALAVGLVAAIAVGYGGGHVLKDTLHLDLLGLDPLLYFLGFSTGWQAMGGDMEVEMEADMGGAVSTSGQEGFATNVNVVDDDESIQYVMDRPIRLRRILETLEASDAHIIKAPTTDQGRDLSKANKYLQSSHTQKYIDNLRKSCNSVPLGSIKRLSNGSSRTYVDSTSFDAAVSAVQDWINAVDYALANDSPAFALTRPPSHHACPTRGMGGCLLNGCAVAAYYAPKTYPDVKRVSILDIDAHHGNGIAACVQDQPPIRYCSIHEFSRGETATLREPRADNPRGPSEGDVGPRMNCKNVVLAAGVGWEDQVGGDIRGYEHALTQRAIPFLKERNPDLLLVACGLDALEKDGTSKLCLHPEDYRKIGQEVRAHFGNKVVFGLEGGYCWADESTVLGDSILELSRAWED